MKRMWIEFEDCLPIVIDHVSSRHVTSLQKRLEENLKLILRVGEVIPVGLLPKDAEIGFTEIKNDERRRMWPEEMEECGEGALMEVFLPAGSRVQPP